MRMNRRYRDLLVFLSIAAGGMLVTGQPPILFAVLAVIASGLALYFRQKDKVKQAAFDGVQWSRVEVSEAVEAELRETWFFRRGTTHRISHALTISRNDTVLNVGHGSMTSSNSHESYLVLMRRLKRDTGQSFLVLPKKMKRWYALRKPLAEVDGYVVLGEEGAVLPDKLEGITKRLDGDELNVEGELVLLIRKMREEAISAESIQQFVKEASDKLNAIQL